MRRRLGGDDVKITEQAIAAMKPDEVLSEPTPCGNITVQAFGLRSRGKDVPHWLVRLDVGGVSLARSEKRAMIYVRERRRMCK